MDHRWQRIYPPHCSLPIYAPVFDVQLLMFFLLPVITIGTPLASLGPGCSIR